MGKQQSLQGRFENIGRSVCLLDHIDSPHWRGEVVLTGLSLRVAKEEYGEALVVLRGIDGEGAPVVGFHSSVGAADALAGAMARMQQGTITWRLDDYAK